MSTKDLLDEAMIESLDGPDKKLDEIWAEEAEKRLKAYRDGKLKGVLDYEDYH